MSDTADFITLFIGLTAFTIGCVMDLISSIEMTKYGIRESNPFVRGKGGKFSVVKGIAFTIFPIVLVLIAFFVPEQNESYDRFWAGIFLLPGAALHYWASTQNWKRIEKAKKPGGVV